MNVRWMAVLTGFVVDIAISALLSLLATPQFYTAPNLAQPGDLLLIGLLALSPVRAARSTGCWWWSWAFWSISLAHPCRACSWSLA